MSTLHTYLSWFLAHPVKDILAAVVFCNIVVSVTPVRYQKTKYFGMFLVFANRVSMLAHAGNLNTIQWPLIAKAIFFGTIDEPAAAPEAAPAVVPVVAPVIAPAVVPAVIPPAASDPGPLPAASEVTPVVAATAEDVAATVETPKV